MKLSSWIVIDGYCATRVLEGTDPAIVANRIAFIEKTPRVRIRRQGTTSPSLDWLNWAEGPKGAGGRLEIDGETIYGFYPPSRKWCDDMLRLLGYQFD